MLRPSATPSPVPPPPEERQDRPTTLPKISLPNVTSAQWVPDENDDSLPAVAWRARRSSRISVKARDDLGHPTSTSSDGTVSPATGIWRTVEGLKETSDQYALAKKRQSGVFGFIGARVEKLADAVFLVFLMALIAYVSRHWQGCGAMPPALPEPGPSVQTR